MELLTACLFQALGGEPEALCAQAHRARGFRGQSRVARRISDSLRTHPDFARRIDEHQWGSHPKPVDNDTEIQDPYSLRCAPQILGAFQESLWHVDNMVTRELNASTDNPLVFPDTQMVIHCGNFYGQQIAMVSDYQRMGLIIGAAGRPSIGTIAQLALQSWPAAVAGWWRSGIEFRVCGRATPGHFPRCRSSLARHAGLHPDHSHQRQ
jgi:histidine ammonia-lyase